jgi:hypothetical protein
MIIGYARVSTDVVPWSFGRRRNLTLTSGQRASTRRFTRCSTELHVGNLRVRGMSAHRASGTEHSASLRAAGSDLAERDRFALAIERGADDPPRDHLCHRVF